MAESVDAQVLKTCNYYGCGGSIPPPGTENNILWDGAVVARWAHNPKVEGSNPSPATNKT